MRNISVLLLSLYTIACASSAKTAEVQIEIFLNEVNVVSTRYRQYSSLPKSKEKIAEGKVSELNQQLISLVPDNEKTAADYFVLGNMLFSVDNLQSHELLKLAEAASPKNPYISLERAIHEHRRRNYEAAVKYYEFSHSELPINPAIWARLTHAYLMIGDIDKAFDSWKQANFHRNHTAIEKAMYSLFSDNRQVRKRSDLVGNIQAGNSGLLCDLYQLDSNWETDWWNYAPRNSHLRFDSKLADNLLTPDSHEFQQYRLCTTIDSMEKGELVQRLNETGILGSNPTLPDSPTLSYLVLFHLMKSKHMNAEEFLKMFGPQLKQLMQENPFQEEYFKIAAYLYSTVGNSAELRKIDWHGWQTLGLQNYAESYVVGFADNQEKFNEFLDLALTDYPNSSILNKFKLALDKDTPRYRDSMIRYVASEFANVKSNWAGPYRLKDFMGSLHHELNRSKN